MLQTPTLTVAAIEKGTAIDHITAGQALKIVRILGITQHKKQVALGLNLPSAQLGLKDIVKIEDREISPQEANQIALFAPNATINIIENFVVSKKFQVCLPHTIANLVVCPNSRCISRCEPISSLFHVQQRQHTVYLSCHFCNKCFLQEEILEYQHH